MKIKVIDFQEIICLFFKESSFLYLLIIFFLLMIFSRFYKYKRIDLYLLLLSLQSLKSNH